MFNSYRDEVHFHTEYQRLMIEYFKAASVLNFEELKQISDEIEELKKETGYYND